MLSPVRRTPQIRNFLTYDLEWTTDDAPVIRRNEWVREPKVRLCGVFDGKRYRSYRSIDDFLNGELTHKNRGRWFYAHAGGLADMLFVMERLLRNKGYRVQASFSGSSAIIVHITQGKNAWHFIDSYWLLRDSLANIAKWIGLRKGDVDFDESTEEELRLYNEDDCVILWKAIDAFELAILELGGQLQMTLASTAMQLFRRKFLTRTIAPSEKVNLISRYSYIGSRVEVFETRCQHANYYDINSSFPYAMTLPAPGNHIASRESLPEGGHYLADVEIEVPESYLPTTPFRWNLSVYFPIGRWRAWLNSVDIELLLQNGGKIHRCWEALVFDSFTDLAEYATTLYEKRRVATTDMEKIVYKLLLNSLYGKFAENSIKTSMLVRPKFTTCPHWPRHPPKPDNPRESLCMEMLMPGVWLIEEEKDIAHGHVPISSHITAHARANLYRLMKKAGEVFYCDTDGFATCATFEKSDRLGELKLEALIRDGYFISPKVYKMEGTKPDGSEFVATKAKGFSLGDKRLMVSRIEQMGRSAWKALPIEEKEKHRKTWMKEISYERWSALQRGEEIEITRMARLRELYRLGLKKPIERTIWKRLQGVALTKRKMYRNGKSRPWRLEEIKKAEGKILA